MNYKDTDYYYFDLKTKNIIHTERYLVEKGECCGSGCKHCPYSPKGKSGNTVINNKFQYLKKTKKYKEK
jgi:hypothetical protein